MDQLRTILQWLKQHHFWVLSGLAAVVALGCWWSGAGALSRQFQQNQSTITAEFASLENVRREPFLPNDDIKRQQIIETQDQAKLVEAVWQQRYARQRERVLEWLANLGLSKAFRDHVERHEFGADVPSALRQEFTDYIDLHFKQLPATIGAREMEGSTMGGRFGGSMPSRGPSGSFMGEGGGRPGGHGFAGDARDEYDDDYLVEWLDQDEVRQELYFDQRASKWRLWWTLENLWVYHTLLEVIKNTNEAAGATRMSNAAVRTIYALEVGQRAAVGSRTKDRIYKVPTAGPPPGEGGFEEMGPEGGVGPPGEFGPEGGMRGPEMPFAGGRGPTGEAMTDEQEAAFLLSHRYLDENGRPIAAGGGGGMEADPYGEGGGGDFPAAPVDQSSFGPEFKRLPVRMILQMDQRYLPQLIAECATQPLQVEVQEVRINPGGIGDGSGMGRGGFGMGGRGFEGGGMGGAPAPPDLSGFQEFPQQAHIAEVVIQGVVYIFRQPDSNVLQLDVDDVD